MPFSFSATPRSDRWIVGARAVCDLKIENTGTSAVEVPNPMFPNSPQPVFHLKRPDGKTISFKPSDRGKDSPLQSIRMLEIPPGAHWLGELILSEAADLSSPGSYTIGGTLDWNGAKADAPAAAFEIVPARLGAISSSLSQDEKGFVVRECMLLQNSSKGREVMAALLREQDSANAEMAKANLQVRGPAPTDAAAIHGVYSNYSTGVHPLRWVVTSGGQSIRVGSNQNSRVAVITPERPLLRILTPLAVRSPALNVLAFLDSPDGAELQFATIGDPEQLPDRVAGRTIWKINGKPHAAASTLAPFPHGSAILCAATLPTGVATRLRLARFGLDGNLQTQGEQTFPDVASTSAISAHWSSQRQIRVCLVASAQGKFHIIDTTFDINFALTAPASISAPLEVKGKVVEIQTTHFEPVPGHVTRFVLFRCENGESFAFDDKTALRPVSTPIPKDVPVALIPGQMYWYGVWPTPTGVSAEAL